MPIQYSDIRTLRQTQRAAENPERSSLPFAFADVQAAQIFQIPTLSLRDIWYRGADLLPSAPECFIQTACVFEPNYVCMALMQMPKCCPVLPHDTFCLQTWHTVVIVR